MKYFAYGSNMNAARMRQEREINFLSREHAVLNGYSLQFNKLADKNPREGKANIVLDANEFVEGVLYDIEPSDIKKLDKMKDTPFITTKLLFQCYWMMEARLKHLPISHKPTG